ncbi:MAG: ABC transporter substrate-binding protein [Tetrasphaera sp.]|nr:ABC transporter substrate-binding protein [Tetrasphaera sp.]
MKNLTRVVAPLGLVALLAACGTSSTNPTSSGSTAPSGSASASGGAGSACGTTVDEIAAAAKKEGQVNLIALPDSWANYGGILAAFRDTYGIKAPVANPDASSADEVTAVKTLRGQPTMPDSVDVGPSFTSQLKEEKLVDVYKTTNWAEIPDNLKDPDGQWVASYYGVLSIGTNTKLVKNPPKTWADLKKPEYKGMVTINGDPREAGAAFAAVMAAALANGGSFDDIMPGIQYYADLQASGNLQVIDVTPAAVLSGDVPIALDWTYNFPGLKAELDEAGFTFETTVPTDGVYGGYYAQSVVSEAIHPCAARLWLEHITGDAGALGYLKGGAVPARYDALLKAGKISEEMKASLPTPEILAQIKFPTKDQIDAAKKVVVENWGKLVADK